MWKLAKKDFAPGLPKKDNLGDESKLKPGQLLTFLIQQHEAERAGTHNDIRIGNPDIGLISWATRKGMPDPGGRIALFQQPLHRFSYKDFEGVISEGYGKGKVKKKEEGSALVTKVTPESIHFTLAHKRHPQRFVLVKPKDVKKGWLLINTTPTKTIPYEKIPYKSIHHNDAEKILNSLEDGSSVQAKIDGAASLTQLLGDRVEVLSYRVSKETEGPIPHTERMFRGSGSMEIPRELKGTVLRGELYGVNAEGKAIPPQELGGILNSSVAKSIATQNAKKISIKNMVFDIEQLGTKSIPKSMPYEERLKLLKGVLKHLPKDKFHLPQIARGTQEALDLYREIASGKNPITKEGIVIHPPSGKPQKVKLTDEHDVHITRTFAGAGKYEGAGAGGFWYSLTSGGPEVGKVGTGISNQLRKDMHLDPKAYEGRVAKIRAQEQLPSGAFRAPSLLSLHEDYPMKKTSEVLFHVAGPSGSGKTTFLNSVSKLNSNILTKDLDDFDDQASEELYPGVKKNIYSEEMIKNLARRRQKLLDTFVSKFKDKKIILGGHHTEGSTILNVHTSNKYLLDVGPLKSAIRAYHRSQKEILYHRRKLLDLPLDYKEAKETITQLKELGYTPIKFNALKAKVAAKRDWAVFDNKLDKESFREKALKMKSTLKHHNLKDYIINFGGYLASKDIVATVPSRTSKKEYKIKKLANGRLGCNCKDWQYKGSVTDTDCAHIKSIKKD